jgi:hypothetical protein
MPRPLHEIAREIQADWKTVDYTAKPYLEAMLNLDSITDKYGTDDGRYIVHYFLVNAGTWRGEVARRVKAELKQMSARRASDDVTTRVAMRHTAGRPGDIPLKTVALTSQNGRIYPYPAVLRPMDDRQSKWVGKGGYLFVVDGAGGGWDVDTFLEGRGPLYIDAGQGWVLDNAYELRAEIQRLLPTLERGGGSAVGASAPDGDGVVAAARELRIAASSNNQVRVRRAMVALLNEITPFNEYLGERDVTARLRLLAKDLASRG